MFAILYAILIPVSSWWLLKMQAYFIDKIDWELLGTNYGQTMLSLYGHLEEHQILSAIHPSKDRQLLDHLANLEKTIGENIQNIGKFREKKLPAKLPDIGRGFSTSTPTLIDTHLWKQIWGDILIQNIQGEKQTNSATYDRLKRDIFSQLQILQSSFYLSFSPDIPTHDLIFQTMTTIPYTVETAVKLILLQDDAKLRGPPIKQQEIDYAGMLILFENLLNNIQILAATETPFQEELAAQIQTNLLSYLSYGKKLLNLLDTHTKDPFQTIETSLDFLKSAQQITKTHFTLIDASLKKTQHYHKFFHYFCILLLIITTFFIFAYVSLRILTTHLLNVVKHIQQMTQGKITKCFCSNSKDEFGEIGRILDKMGTALQKIIGELEALNKQLTDSTLQISTATNEQAAQGKEQETSLRDIEISTKFISSKTQDLFKTMSELSLAAQQAALADHTKAELGQMQEKMNSLIDASSKILEILDGVETEVNNTSRLILFLTKISDQANLLSLNAAIEMANLEVERQDFRDISKKIQRFALTTAHSTKEIQKIISEMSGQVRLAGTEAENCLKEITGGAHRLITANHQLTRIIRHGQDQIQKFDNLVKMIQTQDMITEKIIASISQLMTMTQENRRSNEDLGTTIKDLSGTAGELKKALTLFFTKR